MIRFILIVALILVCNTCAFAGNVITSTVFNGSIGLSKTSTSIGGAAITAGACSKTNVTVTGATTAMIALVTPVTYPGDSVTWDAHVSASNTVTIRLCAMVATTPTASIYNIKLLQ